MATGIQPDYCPSREFPIVPRAIVYKPKGHTEVILSMEELVAQLCLGRSPSDLDESEYVSSTFVSRISDTKKESGHTMSPWIFTFVITFVKGCSPVTAKRVGNERRLEADKSGAILNYSSIEFPSATQQQDKKVASKTCGGQRIGTYGRTSPLSPVVLKTKARWADTIAEPIIVDGPAFVNPALAEFLVASTSRDAQES